MPARITERCRHPPPPTVFVDGAPAGMPGSAPGRSALGGALGPESTGGRVQIPGGHVSSLLRASVFSSVKWGDMLLLWQGFGRLGCQPACAGPSTQQVLNKGLLLPIPSPRELRLLSFSWTGAGVFC